MRRSTVCARSRRKVRKMRSASSDGTRSKQAKLLSVTRRQQRGLVAA